MFIHTLLFSFLLPFIFAADCPQGTVFKTLSLGSFNLTIISDGPAIFPDNVFTVPDAALRRYYRAAFRPVFPIVTGLNCLVVDTPQARILIDAGAVNVPEQSVFDSAGKLIENMKIAGICPESIDAVLITHGHADHVSGIKTVEGGKAYPNAKIYVPQAEHEFWTTEPFQNFKPDVLTNESAAVFKDIYIRSIEPYLDSLELVPEGGAPFPGIKYIPTPGHTPGHVTVRLSSQKKRLLFTADSWISKPDQLENPEWGFTIETDEAQAYDSRTRVLSSAARRRDLVLAFHEVFPGLGYVTENGAAYRWSPV